MTCYGQRHATVRRRG